MSSFPNRLWDLYEKWCNALDSLSNNQVTIDEHNSSMKHFWDEVMDTLNNYPEEAKSQDVCYEYPFESFLDVSFNNDGYDLLDEELLIPPLRICEKFIECCPDALFGLGSSNTSALHSACVLPSAPLSSNIIKLIYEEFPKAAIQPDLFGRLPLHVYVGYDKGESWKQRLEILPYLVRQTPEYFIHYKDRWDRTPLLSLCDALYLTLPSPIESDPIEESSRIEKWKYIGNLITEAAKIKLKKPGKSLEGRNYRVVKDDDPEYDFNLPEIHSVIYMRCLFCFFAPLVYVFSKQLIQREPLYNNLTPLGMVLSSHFFDTSLDNKEVADKKNIFVNNILTTEPRAALIRCTNDLLFPLHLSLLNGYVRYYSDGIRYLVNAAPTVLSVRDPKTHLYPFLLAACASTKCVELVDRYERKQVELEHLETIYVLLREVPWIMEHFIGS